MTMKKIMMTALAMLAVCHITAYANDKPYFGYAENGSTVTIMENYESDKTEYRDRLFALVYDNDELVRVCQALPGEVANEHMITSSEVIEHMKIKAAYINDNGMIEIEAVPHYVTAVVDHVVETNDDVTIFFKTVTDDMPLRMRWRTDGSSVINMTVGGKTAEYTELFNNDVLSIACEPSRKDLDNMPYYDIKVSRSEIEFDLLGADAERNVIATPMGTLKTVLSEDDLQALRTCVEYAAPLDVFGRVTFYYH